MRVYFKVRGSIGYMNKLDDIDNTRCNRMLPLRDAFGDRRSLISVCFKGFADWVGCDSCVEASDCALFDGVFARPS